MYNTCVDTVFLIQLVKIPIKHSNFYNKVPYLCLPLRNSDVSGMIKFDVLWRTKMLKFYFFVLATKALTM